MKLQPGGRKRRIVFFKVRNDCGRGETYSFYRRKKGLEEKKENRHHLACCNHVRSIIQPFHQQRVKLIYFDCFHGLILGARAGVLCSELRIPEFRFISVFRLHLRFHYIQNIVDDA